MMYSFQRGLAVWRRRGQHAATRLVDEPSAAGHHATAPAPPGRWKSSYTTPAAPPDPPCPANLCHVTCRRSLAPVMWPSRRCRCHHHGLELACPSLLAVHGLAKLSSLTAGRASADMRRACAVAGGSARHSTPPTSTAQRSSARCERMARRRRSSGAAAACVCEQHGNARHGADTNRERGGRAWMVVGAGRGDGGGGMRLARSGRGAAQRHGWQPRRGRCSLR
jgi:hypothetical protein